METESRRSGVTIERERNGGERSRGHVRERKEKKMAGGMQQRKSAREFQDLCSCVSILNNQVCVRGSTHQQRTARIVEGLSQYKKGNTSVKSYFTLV